jgi:hypothetical protein
MLSVDRADLDVIAVLNKDLGEGERKTEHSVDVTLDEEHAAGLVSHRQAVGQLGSCAEPEEDRLFMIRPGDARTFYETTFPLVGSLIVDTIEYLIKDGLYY